MPYGYLGQNTPNQTVSNSGVFSISDVADLEKQGKFGGSLELIEEQTYSSAVSFVDFTSIQENKYDVHYVTIENAVGSNAQVQLQFYESGVLETASVYQYALQFCATNGTFLELKSTANGHIQIGNSSSNEQNAYVYLYNLGNSSKYSFATLQYMDNDNDDGRAVAMFGGGVLPQASTVDGIRLKLNSGNYSSFTIKLYGVKQL